MTREIADITWFSIPIRNLRSYASLGYFSVHPGSVPRFLAIGEKAMNALVRQGMACMLGTWLLSTPLYAQFVPQHPMT